MIPYSSVHSTDSASDIHSKDRYSRSSTQRKALRDPRHRAPAAWQLGWQVGTGSQKATLPFCLLCSSVLPTTGCVTLPFCRSNSSVLPTRKNIRKNVKQRRTNESNNAWTAGAPLADARRTSPVNQYTRRRTEVLSTDSAGLGVLLQSLIPTLADHGHSCHRRGVQRLHAGHKLHPCEHLADHRSHALSPPASCLFFASLTVQELPRQTLGRYGAASLPTNPADLNHTSKRVRGGSEDKPRMRSAAAPPPPTAREARRRAA